MLLFASLDETFDWIDRNQLGRRNLTDEQRTLVIGRIYEREKKNQVLNLKPFQSAQNEHSEKEGSAATAEKIASEFGVTQATVRRAAEFARAFESLENISPEAAKLA